MKYCQKCFKPIPYDAIFCNHCNNPVYYRSIDEVQNRLSNVVIFILIISCLFWAVSCCPTNENPRDVTYYHKGKETYKTALILFNENADNKVDINKVDSIYDTILKRNQSWN